MLTFNREALAWYNMYAAICKMAGPALSLKLCCYSGTAVSSGCITNGA